MLRVVDDAVALIREVAPIAERVGRRDPALAKQLRDALNSAASSMIEAARAMKSAADTQSSAATTSLQAAHTPVKVDVDSYVYVEYIDPSNGA